ncbi:gamma-glutamylcyclotransferase family protein [Spirosoma aerophilum]
MTHTPDFLIVYGTLRPPFDNTFSQYLRQRGRYVGEGSFTGQSFDMGSYPGAVYQPDSQSLVHGSVFDISNQKAAILTYLDYYEGVGEGFEQPTEYIRAIIPVQFNHQTADCWIYLYNLSTDDKPLIESGDYSIHIGKPFSWPA